MMASRFPGDVKLILALLPVAAIIGIGIAIAQWAGWL